MTEIEENMIKIRKNLVKIKKITIKSKKITTSQDIKAEITIVKKIRIKKNLKHRFI